jgi:hypothetical protein
MLDNQDKAADTSSETKKAHAATFPMQTNKTATQTQ